MALMRVRGRLSGVALGFADSTRLPVVGAGGRRRLNKPREPPAKSSRCLFTRMDPAQGRALTSGQECPGLVLELPLCSMPTVPSRATVAAISNRTPPFTPSTSRQEPLKVFKADVFRLCVTTAPLDLRNAAPTAGMSERLHVQADEGNKLVALKR